MYFYFYFILVGYKNDIYIYVMKHLLLKKKLKKRLLKLILHNNNIWLHDINNISVNIKFLYYIKYIIFKI